MKSKFLNRREILILGLPFLLIGAGALFLNARDEQRREVEKQKMARASGPLRTVITKVNIEEVTPFEAWQGYSNKVTVDVELQGDQTVPAGFKARDYFDLSSDVYLTHEKRGKPEKIGVGRRISDASKIRLTDDAPLVMVWRGGGSNNVYGFRTFLIRAQKLGNGPLRLRGTVRLQQNASASFKNLDLHKEWTYYRSPYDKIGTTGRKSASTASFDVLIPRNPGKVIDKSQPVVTEKKKFSISPSNQNNGINRGQGETKILVRLKSIKVTDSSSRLFTVGPTDILDQHNRPVTLPKIDGYSPSIRFDRSQTSRDGFGLLERDISVWSIPHSYGTLTYRTWLSFGDSWPVEVKIPLRTQSDLKKPDLLALDSIRVDKGNVKVRVKYLGVFPVSTKDNNGFLDSRLYADEMDTFVLQETDEVVNRLISNWSQHLIAPNGEEYWLKSAVKVKTVTAVTPSLYEIVYETNSLDTLKAGETMKFSAQVGIEGDGFIPIEAKITKSK